LPAALFARQFAQFKDGFIARGLDETTGVDNQNAGL